MTWAFVRPQRLEPRLRARLAPPVDGGLETYAVAGAVNNVKNSGPGLLDPLPATKV